jgi:hypothetical protein
MNRSVHFGYNPPSSDRGLEIVDASTFAADLERVLGVLGDAFDSVWVSGHFMTNDRFRLECWTLSRGWRHGFLASMSGRSWPQSTSATHRCSDADRAGDSSTARPDLHARLSVPA